MTNTYTETALFLDCGCVVYSDLKVNRQCVPHKAEQSVAFKPIRVSRDNEPPIGTWVKDRHGATSQRAPSGGWGQPGMMPFGKWTAMWDARGPLEICSPWGIER